MGTPAAGSDEWLDQVVEEVLLPELPIVDPHHHLYPADPVPGGRWERYGLRELHADTQGHNVVATVFVEARGAYDLASTDPFTAVQETEFVAQAADADPRDLIRGIVARAELRSPELDAVLDAHTAAAGGRMRGIRHLLARDPGLDRTSIEAAEGIFTDPSFRAGVARLGERDLTYDTYLFHHQLLDLRELARAVPGTTIVLNHLGTPLGVGPHASRREEIFAQWRLDLEALAACPNVRVKLGGMAMADNGFGWHTHTRPPSSDEFVAAQERYYLHAIDCFGPKRSMFESNFPADRISLSYGVLWNAFTKIAARFSPDEQRDLLARTAIDVYALTGVSL